MTVSLGISRSMLRILVLQDQLVINMVETGNCFISTQDTASPLISCSTRGDNGGI